jgi:hypothetical protein
VLSYFLKKLRHRLRNATFGLISPVLASLICLGVAYIGHGLAWTWPDQPGLQRYVILDLMVVFCCPGLLFARRFLDLENHALAFGYPQGVRFEFAQLFHICI